jgi:hypothetical protein
MFARLTLLWILLLVTTSPVLGQDVTAILEGIGGSGTSTRVHVYIGSTRYVCADNAGRLKVLSQSASGDNLPLLKDWALVGLSFVDANGRRVAMGGRVLMARDGRSWKDVTSQGSTGWNGADLIAVTPPDALLRAIHTTSSVEFAFGNDLESATGILHDNSLLDKRLEEATAALRAGSADPQKIANGFRLCLGDAIALKNRASRLPSWSIYQNDLLPTLRAQVRRCEELVRAFDHERRYGRQAANTLWSAQLKTYQAYQQALKQTQTMFFPTALD